MTVFPKNGCAYYRNRFRWVHEEAQNVVDKHRDYVFAKYDKNVRVS